MIISLFSAGVSSFIATYLARDIIDEIIYTHIDNQHPDSLRFVNDCSIILGKPITILQSEYKNVDNVIIANSFINFRYGAKCTDILKKRVRKQWEYNHRNIEITYIWGYDTNEKHRAERVIEDMPKFKHLFPLIENNMSKEDAHGLAKALGIKRPAMYDLGYPNNNCIGCVKGGMGYWNKIRKDFPDVFKHRAEQERTIGHTCIKGIYLDELEPGRGNMNTEIFEKCSYACQMHIPD